MLEGFASHFGADFYGLKRNAEKIILEKNSWTVPKSYGFSDSKVIPFLAEEQLSWRLMS
jgi:dihydroorotase